MLDKVSFQLAEKGPFYIVMEGRYKHERNNSDISYP